MLDKPTPPKGGGRRRAAATETKAHLSLPDPTLPGPFRPFASDPGRSEQSWWLWLPVAMAAALLVIFQLDTTFYLAWILPEGYGFLEFTQFVVAGAAALLAFWLLFNGYVRSRPLILAFLALSGLACLYIAGEEMSWGQHLFHWTTPAYWAELNRQQETNLHNMYDIFDKTPRNLLTLGIVIGGLIVPLICALRPQLRAMRWSLFLPPAALVPTALMAVGFLLIGDLQKLGIGKALMQRPSEVMELYLYLFLLFYLIVFARRIRELESDTG